MEHYTDGQRWILWEVLAGVAGATGAGGTLELSLLRSIHKEAKPDELEWVEETFDFLGWCRESAAKFERRCYLGTRKCEVRR